MKKAIASLLSVVLILTALIPACISSANEAAISIDRLAVFGDSVMYGYSAVGYKLAPKSLGDQTLSDLLAQEYGLTDYKKDATAERWFLNKSVSGYTTPKILEAVMSVESTDLATADAVIFDGGINETCFTLSSFMSKIQWGSVGKTMSAEQAREFIRDDYSKFSGIADIVSTNFIKMVDYLNALEGFAGQIYIQNNLNPYAGSEYEGSIALWDDLIYYCISKPQKEVADLYDNVHFVDVCGMLRDGAKYTGADIGDALHATFAGHREFYKIYSEIFNPAKTNMLQFEDNTIPANASWKTLYDWESYELGATSVVGITGGNVQIVATDSVKSTNDNTVTLGDAISGSTKALFTTSSSLYVDLSAVSKNAYGYRILFHNPSASVGYQYANYSCTTRAKQSGGYNELQAFCQNNKDNWSVSEITADRGVGYPGAVATCFNVSDTQSAQFVRVCGGSNFYIDDVQVLTTDETLPDASVGEGTIAVTTTAAAATTVGDTTAATTAAPQTGDRIVYEVEQCRGSSNVEVATSTHNDYGCGGNTFVDIGLKSIAVGDYIEFNCAGLAAGKYRLIAPCRTTPSRSIFQLSVDGTPVGEPIDFAGTAFAAYTEIDCGEITVVDSGSGVTKIRFTVTTVRSVGFYMDKLVFVKQDSGEPTTATTAAATTITTAATTATTIAPTTLPTTIAVVTTTIAPTTIASTTAAPTTAATTATTTVEITTVATTVQAVLYGDANLDGVVNAKDLLTIRQHLAQWSVLINLQTADCNADGNINARDILLLRQYLASWDVILGK